MVDLKNHLLRFASYESFILIGLVMAVLTFLKLVKVIDFSSDLLWLLAGVGLVVEGTISLIKQKRFDKKFKVVERRK